MISIIVVGRNEGWRLKKCLESISRLFVCYPNLVFEVLYIDSRSTDDSIDIARGFPWLRIFEITGKANSAIARNIGGNESNGDILFFVDGDMEIDEYFLGHALDDHGKLVGNYVTGHLDDYFYTTDDFFLGFQPRTYASSIPKHIQQLTQNGGLFLISRHIWISIGGMNSKYRRSQDLDVSIRLRKFGVSLIRIPFLAAKHHTIDYQNESRMWDMLWSGNGFFPGLLLRDHFFDTSMLWRAIRSNYSAIILFISVAAKIFDNRLFLFLLFFYFVILLLRTYYQTVKAKITKNRVFYFFERIVVQFFLDLSFWYGFLFFFPRNFSSDYRKL